MYNKWVLFRIAFVFMKIYHNHILLWSWEVKMSCQTRKERWKKPPSGTSTPWRSSHEKVSQRTWRPSASSKSLCCSTSPAAGGKWMWVQSTQFHKTLFLLSLFNHSDIMRKNWDCPDYINLVWSPHVKWLFGLPIQPIDNLFLL